MDLHFQKHISYLGEFKTEIIGSLFSFLIIYQIENIQLERINSENREKAVTSLTLVQTQIASVIENDMERLERLVIALNQNPNWSREEYETYILNLISGRKEISHISVAKNFILELVAPIKGNESTFGLDYRKIPAQYAAVKSVIDQGHTVVTNIINLVQGGQAIIARVPYAIEQNESEPSIGVIALVWRAETLLKPAQDLAEDDRYLFAIQSSDEIAGKQTLIVGDLAAFDQNPTVVSLPLKGNTWDFAIALNPAAQNGRNEFSIWVIRLVGLTCVIMFWFLNITTKQKKAVIRALEKEIETRHNAEKQSKIARLNAENANRVKSEFLANMSHDLRTPMNAIMGFSEMMMLKMQGPLGSPKYDDYAQAIFDSSNYLLQLINDILDISKIEAGEFKLHFETVNLTETISSSLNLLRPLSTQKKVKVINRLTDGNVEIQADQRAINQILLNLFANAMKFSNDGGEIVVDLKHTATSEEIIISDKGIGIPKEKLGEILKPFVQSGNNPNHSAEGTGLGLSIVLALVKLHKGELIIESVEGEGTTVHVILPKG